MTGLFFFLFFGFLGWGLWEYYLPSEYRVRALTPSEVAEFKRMWCEGQFQRPMFIGVDPAAPGSDKTVVTVHCGICGAFLGLLDFRIDKSEGYSCPKCGLRVIACLDDPIQDFKSQYSENAYCQTHSRFFEKINDPDEPWA